MKLQSCFSSTLFALFSLCALPIVHAQNAEEVVVSPKDFTEYAEEYILPTSKQVTFAKNSTAGSEGLEVTIQPGAEDFPGVHLKSPNGEWSLSSFGHLETRVTNTGDIKTLISVRIDGKDRDGSDATNTEVKEILPGDTQTIKVVFGYAYGRKPAAKLDPSMIKKVVIFTKKYDTAVSFRVEEIKAGGVPE